MHALRTTRLGFAALAASLGVGGGSAAAQQPALPPIRPLGSVVARSTTAFRNLRAVRALPDGRVLAYDAGARRVLLLDASLANSTVVVDSTPMPQRPLGFGGALLPLCGDSSLYVDGVSATAIVLDPSARVVRRMALPSTWLAASGILNPSVHAVGDCGGRVVYREPPPSYLTMVPPTFRGDTIVAGPDSMALLRFALASKHLDTLVVVRAPRLRQALTRFERGGRGLPAQDPLAGGGGDDWAMLGDGTIAVVRSKDYHVDWIGGGGRRSGPRVPHQWTAIDSTRKVALVDSLRRVMGAARADSLFPFDSARYDSLALVAAANPEALVGPDGKRMPLGPRPMRLQFVAPADLPDSLPPFTSGGTFADSGGGLWIQEWPAMGATGVERFDVLDRQGVLVDRVALPAGAVLLAVAGDTAIYRAADAKGPAIVKARAR
jgi:hypothetical protein